VEKKGKEKKKANPLLFLFFIDEVLKIYKTAKINRKCHTGI